MAGGGDSTIHFASIRMIVNGTGILQMSVHSMDDIRIKTLVPFTLTNTIRVFPTRLVNFMEQRALFEFTTTNIDEVLRISRIVVYTKEVFTSYPGN